MMSYCLGLSTINLDGKGEGKSAEHLSSCPQVIHLLPVTAWTQLLLTMAWVMATSLRDLAQTRVLSPNRHSSLGSPKKERESPPDAVSVAWMGHRGSARTREAGATGPPPPLLLTSQVRQILGVSGSDLGLRWGAPTCLAGGGELTMPSLHWPSCRPRKLPRSYSSFETCCRRDWLAAPI